MLAKKLKKKWKKQITLTQRNPLKRFPDKILGIRTKKKLIKNTNNIQTIKIN